MTLEQKYSYLVEGLSLLACSYEEQIGYLPDRAVVQDEVLELFDEAFLFLPDIIEKELLSYRAIASIVRTYNFMDMTFSSQQDQDDFKNHESWNRVRSFAKESLVFLGEAGRRPDSEFLSRI